MAQTVALQRGTTTVTGNGSSFADLFTQSSGIATRVILNGVACYASSTDTRLYACLLVKSAGSSTNVLTVATKSYGNNQNVGAFDFSVVDGIADNLGPWSPTSNQGTTNKANMAATNTTTATQGGTTFATTMNYIYVSGTGSNINTNDVQYFAVPRDFWIGPSDIVSLKIFTANTRTWTIAYSFTTVTES